MDAWDLLDPVDIASKLPKDFVEEQLANKKWQDRKAALEMLHGILTENPKLADNPDYRDLIDQLVKMLGSDANINCAAMAAKDLLAFAKGLRTKFGPCAASVVPVIFEKFKEKKAALREPLVELADAVYASSNLTTLAPLILEAIGKPNPSQKAQLDQFLYRIFRCILPKDIPKGFLKDLVMALSEHAFDPDPEVRDSSMAALGAIQKCVSEKSLAMFLGSKVTSDPVKMAKIKEYESKAEAECAALKADESQNSGQTVQQAGRQQNSADKTYEEPTTHVQQSNTDVWDLLDPVDITPKLPKDLLEQLANPKWQERKAALDMLHDILKENPKLADNPDYRELIDQFIKMLGSDANINCAAMAAKNLLGFAKGLRTKFSPCTASVMPVIFAKFKEKKAALREPLVELADAVYASSNLTALMPFTMEAINKPNPSQKAQLDLFLYRIFRSLAPKDIPKGSLKELIAALSEHAFDPDPEVRDSSMAALGAIQKCVGEKSLAMFLGSKVTSDPVKMAKIKEYEGKAVAECPVSAKAAEECPPSTQTSSQAVQQSNNKQQKIAANKIVTAYEEEPTIQIQQPEQPKMPSGDLNPVDIIPKLPKDLLEQLGNKNWQERKAALDMLHGILTENPKLADNPDYRQIIDQLVKMLASDANINCAVLAVKNLLGFAKGLRTKFGPCAASVASVIFEKFKEKKAALREPLVELADAVYASSNLTTLMPFIMETLSKPNPSQRTQLDLFLCRIFRNLYPKDIPKGTLKDLVANLSEQTFVPDPEVREASLAALGAIQKCVGEKALAAFLSNKVISDPVKMAKISECRERAVRESPSPASQTPLSGSQQARARSASGTRRSMAVVPGHSSGNDDSARPPRRSHAGFGLSSAQSHSALNSTFNMTGRFQLDPKFFANDFDEPTLTLPTPPNTTKMGLNTTLTMGREGPAERGVLGRNGNGADSIQQDLQPIKPVVRPTSTFSRRSESVSSISSLESAEHIDRTVHNVSNLQLPIAEEAIAQLLHLLNDPNNRKYIFDRVETILKTIVTQVFHIRTQHLEQLESSKEGSTEGEGLNSARGAELTEFMRSICNFLSSLTKEPALIQKISSDTLRGFLDSILTLITDQRLSNLNNQIYKSLNIIVIRLCDHTNPNSLMHALMKLITKYQTQDPNGKMMDLVWKCMIKHADMLADPVKVMQIDVPTVLELIHGYFSRFYVDKDKITDSVKQSVKILSVYLQRLVVCQRYSILNYLYPYPESSYLVNYIRRCVRAIGKRAAEDKTTDGHPTMPDEMVKLFTRIDEDIFCGAVEELYNFMDIHPEQNNNFEQLMAQCEYSAFVRKAFIEIRQCKLQRLAPQPGACVRRVLPLETIQFLDQNAVLNTRLDELTAKFLNETSTVQGSQKSTPS